MMRVLLRARRNSQNILHNRTNAQKMQQPVSVLMRLKGLEARLRLRRLPKDGGDRQIEIVPANLLLDRQFATERPKSEVDR